MDLSQNALDIIQQSEGLVLNAAPDPGAGIPTIGYGTIAYPNGRKVEIGDSISPAEASAFLKFDCDRTAAGVTQALAGMAAGQNQFDALVSFAYNLGLGTLMSSTLLKKLKSGDFAGAAGEFPRFNKAMVRGVKVELPGLSARRAKERALFERKDTPGAPMPSPPSDAEAVVAAKGFKRGGANILATFNSAGGLVELLEFADASPLTIIAALKAYPNLDAFDFAAPGEALPPGPQISFSGLSQAISKAKRPPKLGHELIVVGMEDADDGVGDDIRNMQSRLADLGYYSGPVDGIFGLLTDRAARQFQADYFGRAEADGLVGPKTWAKLWGDFKPARPPKPEAGTSAPGKHYLKLTKADSKDEFGCFILTLAYFRDGLFAAAICVCSGQPRKQSFRKGADSPACSMEPLPEGKWSVGNIEWAGGKDNYSGPVWNSGLGPAKIHLEFVGPGKTAREGIEIHIDWNRPTAPGTAGCIGALNVADHKMLVGWLRESDPKALYVDWGLGTCPSP